MPRHFLQNAEAFQSKRLSVFKKRRDVFKDYSLQKGKA